MPHGSDHDSLTAGGWLNIERVVCCLQVKSLPGTGSLELCKFRAAEADF